MRDEVTELKSDLKERTRDLKQTQQEAQKSAHEVMRLKATADEKASISAGIDAGYDELVDGAVDEEAPAAPETKTTDNSDADRIIAEAGPSEPSTALTALLWVRNRKMPDMM